MPKTKPRSWRYSTGHYPHTVSAFERQDRGGAVYVKFTDAGRSGRDKRRKVRLEPPVYVRDSGGRRSASLERMAEIAVREFAARRTLNTNSVPESSSALTLAEGFARLLDLTEGKFSTRTRRWDEVDRGRRRLMKMLGPDRTWQSITPADMRGLWRTMAIAYKNGESVTGPRQTEVTIDALYSTATWLRSENRLEANVCLPWPQWRVHLTVDWENISGREVRPERPRHGTDELRAIYAALKSARVDPRMALAMDCGGEQRLGQVLKCWRSHLDLPLIASGDRHDRPVGTLWVPPAGNKFTSPIALLKEHRQHIESSLHGYLRDYEALWLKHGIDYPLFPGGRLVKGVARLVDAPRPLSRDGARNMFRALEAIAGVPHSNGRGWYGIRRRAIDLAEDLESDERVLNASSGHRDSATRRLIYQEQHRPEILEAAAHLRRRIRTTSDQGDESASA